MPPIINKPKPNLTYHNYVSNPKLSMQTATLKLNYQNVLSKI